MDIYDYTWIRRQDLTSKEIKFIYANLCMHPNIYMYIQYGYKKKKNFNTNMKYKKLVHLCTQTYIHICSTYTNIEYKNVFIFIKWYFNV